MQVRRLNLTDQAISKCTSDCKLYDFRSAYLNVTKFDLRIFEKELYLR